jgi:hypothetical protein
MAGCDGLGEDGYLGQVMISITGAELLMVGVPVGCLEHGKFHKYTRNHMPEQSPSSFISAAAHG